MGMSRCYSLMKCLLIIFNIIFLGVGCGAGGFAAWALYEGRAGESAAARAGLCALAGWAAALAAGALAALAGAVRHSASLLAVAFALLALSGVAEGAAAWWGAAHVPQLRAALRDSLARTVRSDYGRLPSRTHLIDAIQHGLHCCGSEGARDWQQSAWARSASPAPAPAPAPLDLSVSAPPAYYEVPASCCERLSHWIKDTLSSSGIDTNMFSAHSTRHAATSRANRLGVNLDVIRKTAGWTQNSCVFARFYNKEIVHNTNQFAMSILNCSVNQ